MKEKSCKLKLAGKVGCYRITVSEPVNIHTRSEMIKEGKPNIPVLRRDDLYIFGPTERMYQTG